LLVLSINEKIVRHHRIACYRPLSPDTRPFSGQGTVAHLRSSYRSFSFI
jgi:hypothetical protein